MLSTFARSIKKNFEFFSLNWENKWILFSKKELKNLPFDVSFSPKSYSSFLLQGPGEGNSDQ